MAEDLVMLSQVVQKQCGACPGCGHPVFLRLIMECVWEAGYEGKCISVPGVGCCALNHEIINNEKYYPVPHGRAAAVATGIKRTNKEVLVYTFQGDGDAMVIGLSETLNAAYRNENFCMFISNNNFFSMTGGQLAWTTLEGQKTVSTPNGRDCSTTGSPFHLPEMIAREFNVAYAARGAVDTPRHIMDLKKMVKNAIGAQINKEGFSIVEALIMCPTSWGCTPLQSREAIKDRVMPEYPLGVFKDRQERRQPVQ